MKSRHPVIEDVTENHTAGRCQLRGGKPDLLGLLCARKLAGVVAWLLSPRLGDVGPQDFGRSIVKMEKTHRGMGSPRIGHRVVF